MIEIEYDGGSRAAYVRFSDEPVARTVELAADVFADVTSTHVLVGVEMLGVQTPASVIGKLAVTKFTAHGVPVLLSEAVQQFLASIVGPPVRVLARSTSTSAAQIAA